MLIYEARKSGRTLKAVGREFKLTRERVRQIVSRIDDENERVEALVASLKDRRFVTTRG